MLLKFFRYTILGASESCFPILPLLPNPAFGFLLCEKPKKSSIFIWFSLFLDLSSVSFVFEYGPSSRALRESIDCSVVILIYGNCMFDSFFLSSLRPLIEAWAISLFLTVT